MTFIVDVIRINVLVSNCISIDRHFRTCMYMAIHVILIYELHVIAWQINGREIDFSYFYRQTAILHDYHCLFAVTAT